MAPYKEYSCDGDFDTTAHVYNNIAGGELQQ